VNYAVILCSDCKQVPITLQPKEGTAKTWEKIVICDACAQKWIERQQQANVQVPPKPSS